MLIKSDCTVKNRVHNANKLYTVYARTILRYAFRIINVRITGLNLLCFVAAFMFLKAESRKQACCLRGRVRNSRLPLTHTQSLEKPDCNPDGQ